MLGGNAVVHHQAAFTHCIGKDVAVLIQVGVPHVLKHAHADDFVEAAVLRQITVVEQLQVDLVLQAFGLDAFTAQCQLLFAQGNAKDLDPVLACGKTRQPAPATTNVEQILTRFQAQLAAQQAKLGLLSFIKGLFTGLEIATRIGHVAVKPQLIKLIGQVVVVRDGSGVDFFVVVNTRRSSVLFLYQRLAQLITHTNHFFDGAFQLKLPLNKSGAQQVKAGVGKLGNQLRVFDHNRDTRLWP